VLWFEPYPWGRWALVVLVAVFALYLEFRPDPSIDVPFARVGLQPGDELSADNTEMRRVPAGLIDGADLGDVTTRPVTEGDPVLATDVGPSDALVPSGWWVVGVSLPLGASPGDPVRLVLLETGLVVDGVVAYPGSDDPFAAADGGVAVPPDSSKDVALAAADGRLAVLVASG
jgi:SAF domain